MNKIAGRVSNTLKVGVSSLELTKDRKYKLRFIINYEKEQRYFKHWIIKKWEGRV